jgi:hypothetical protein
MRTTVSVTAFIIVLHTFTNSHGQITLNNTKKQKNTDTIQYVELKGCRYFNIIFVIEPETPKPISKKQMKAMWKEILLSKTYLQQPD